MSMEHIAAAINRAHNETTNVILVLENMAGQGSVLGSTFEELRYIIDRVTLKSRVGVCLDTCHAFAAGKSTRFFFLNSFVLLLLINTKRI